MPGSVGKRNSEVEMRCSDTHPMTTGFALLVRCWRVRCNFSPGPFSPRRPFYRRHTRSSRFLLCEWDGAILHSGS